MWVDYEIQQTCHELWSTEEPSIRTNQEATTLLDRIGGQFAESTFR